MCLVFGTMEGGKESELLTPYGAGGGPPPDWRTCHDLGILRGALYPYALGLSRRKGAGIPLPEAQAGDRA